MVANWIYRLTGARWPVSLARVMLWLVVCLLVGALTPAAAFALGNQDVVVTASTTPAAQPAAYRYTGLPDGTTEVQRSNDAGLTWAAIGTIPEPVAQLAVNPTNDTVLVARTGARLWRSRDSGSSWAQIDSLPGHPLALAFAGSSDPSGLVFAGTDTQGLYSSLDGGATWHPAGGPLSPFAWH